ncbi:MAG: DUF2058 domain-containing protein [Pseudomonadota bacterium]
MADSLRDQLIKAGLATKSQAKKADKQKNAEANAQRQRKKKPGGKSAAPTQGEKNRQRANKARAVRAERDRALARERNEKAAEKAKLAEIKQLVAKHDQRREKAESDVPYNFLHKKKIKRIYVQPAQLDALSRGALVIVNVDGLYHLVSQAVAKRIEERDPRWIVADASKAEDAPDEAMDDYYKQFEVPDDLDW